MQFRGRIDERVLQAAEASFAAYRAAPAETRARLLEEIAEAMLAKRDEIVDVADQETKLGLPRLEGELGRTVNQLRLFAGVVRDGSWVDARIDTRDAARTPPKPDVRRMLVPLGPVVVFAASNFPLAFSTAGGDTASALAAGCPVVLVVHPASPGTGAAVGVIVESAVERCGLPKGLFSCVLTNGDHELNLDLVKHPLTRAVAFTGSLRGGRALFDAAASRPDPIPVYAEMGSTNPVFVLPGALAERGAALGATLADSATQGVGQFCTKPGLVFAVDGAGFEAFTAALAARVGEKAPAPMLYDALAARFREGVAGLAATTGVVKLSAAPGDEDGRAGRPAAFQVSLDDFLRTPALHEEVFGPATLVVRASSVDDLSRAADALEGQLTASVHATTAELPSAAPLVAKLERKVGRLLFGGVPTGVEVGAAMNHGGPYPATTDARTTSVGTAAIMRFVRPLAWQDAPQAALPVELRDGNQRGIWRLVDGKLTRDALA
ncbi:MAG TPA: aldehyde dehydrogenase (NADP(+)) [Polyangia bacterium]|nr:aldehyde dehydrogenase (NADP(+)) [Polyangia bacterium]